MYPNVMQSRPNTRYYKPINYYTKTLNPLIYSGYLSINQSINHSVLVEEAELLQGQTLVYS